MSLANFLVPDERVSMNEVHRGYYNERDMAKTYDELDQMKPLQLNVRCGEFKDTKTRSRTSAKRAEEQALREGRLRLRGGAQKREGGDLPRAHYEAWSSDRGETSPE